MILRCLILCCLALGAVMAQNIPTEKYNGEKCYVHEVETGHTLYGIAVKYGVSMQDIISFNPGIDSVLTVGKILYVPISKADKKWVNKGQIQLEDNMIIHRVEKGETIFSIARKYNTSVNEIYENNPDLDQNIQIGQGIKIKKRPNNDIVALSSDPGEDSLVHHIIKQGETLYSLARYYKVTIESIVEVNPGLNVNDVPLGYDLRLPILTEAYITKKGLEGKMQGIADAFNNEDNILIDTSYAPKRKVTIALFLPFELNKNALNELNSNTLETGLSKATTNIIKFYGGVKMALDSLQALGLSYDLVVYDTQKDTNVAQIAARNLLLKYETVDLVIGPLYTECFDAVAELMPKDVPMVCPLSSKGSTLLGNPNVFKVVPSPISQVEKIAAFVAQYYNHENVILLNPIKAKSDKSWFGIVEQNSKEIWSQNENQGSIQSAEFSYGLGTLKPLLKLDQTNVIVLPTDDKAIVAYFITELKKLRNLEAYKEYKFTIVGMENWQDFNTIEDEVKVEFNWHFPSYKFDSFSDSLTKPWVRNFRFQYNLDPEFWGLTAFDMTYFFGKDLLDYGPNILKSIPEKANQQPLRNTMKFFSTGVDGGFENRALYMLEYRDFELKKVNYGQQAAH